MDSRGASKGNTTKGRCMEVYEVHGGRGEIGIEWGMTKSTGRTYLSHTHQETSSP